MDAAEYDEIRERLRVYAEEALLDIVTAFSFERLIRIDDPVTWSEVIDGDEIQFELVILDCDEESVHISLEAILGGIGGPSFSVGENVRRPTAAP